MQRGQFTVDSEALAGAAMSLLYAMRNIRKMVGLPMDRYERDEALNEADHAQKAL